MLTCVPCVPYMACTQVPDLSLSTELIDFGHVRTGLAKCVVLQLTNTKQVPCEWAVKRPIEGHKAKDWQFFRCGWGMGRQPGLAWWLQGWAGVAR